MALTTEEVERVEEAMTDLVAELVPNGVELFQLWFEQDPDLQEHFLDDKEAPLTDENAELRSLVTHVMTLLRSWFFSLRDHECLTHLLNHHKKKYADDVLTPNKFKRMELVLTEFAEKKLGEKFTEASREAWEKAYKIIEDGLADDH